MKLLRGLGKFIKSVGEELLEYQVVKSGRENHGCGEEYNVEKKRKGKQYHLPYTIKAVGKIIKLGRGEGRDGNFGEENQD